MDACVERAVNVISESECVRMMAQRKIKLLDCLTPHARRRWAVATLLEPKGQRLTAKGHTASKSVLLLPAVTLLAKIGRPDDGPQCTSRITAIPLSAAFKPVIF